MKVQSISSAWRILPLKLQGVTDITDGAIACRLKITAEPAHASLVQREALRRVYAALEAKGIAFSKRRARAGRPYKYLIETVTATCGCTSGRRVGGGCAFERNRAPSRLMPNIARRRAARRRPQSTARRVQYGRGHSAGSSNSITALRNS